MVSFEISGRDGLCLIRLRHGPNYSMVQRLTWDTEDYTMLLVRFGHFDTFIKHAFVTFHFLIYLLVELSTIR